MPPPKRPKTALTPKPFDIWHEFPTEIVYQILKHLLVVNDMHYSPITRFYMFNRPEDIWQNFIFPRDPDLKRKLSFLWTDISPIRDLARQTLFNLSTLHISGNLIPIIDTICSVPDLCGAIRYLELHDIVWRWYSYSPSHIPTICSELVGLSNLVEVTLKTQDDHLHEYEGHRIIPHLMANSPRIQQFIDQTMPLLGHGTLRRLNVVKVLRVLAQYVAPVEEAIRPSWDALNVACQTHEDPRLQLLRFEVLVRSREIELDISRGAQF